MFPLLTNGNENEILKFKMRNRKCSPRRVFNYGHSIMNRRCFKLGISHWGLNDGVVAIDCAGNFHFYFHPWCTNRRPLIRWLR